MALRNVTLIGASCLLAGWLLASVVLPPVASLQSNVQPPQRQGASPSAAPAAAPYTERLRLKLREAPAAPTPRRNPFRFQRGPQPTVSPEAPEDPTALSLPAAAAPGLPLALAGIATTASADGPARTAVLSSNGDVVLARAGDVLPDGYRVVRVDEESVTLSDATGQELVLRLK
jgi:type IV pilus biogenesis protein PilP